MIAPQWVRCSRSAWRGAANMTLVPIAIFEDQPLMAEAIELLLSTIPEYKVIATGACADDIYGICAVHKPSIIIVELGLSGDVYEAISAAVKATPSCKVVAFTAAAGVEFAIRALDAGAHAYVLKRGSSQELLKAIKSVNDGGTYITQSFASKVIAALSDTAFRRRAAEPVKFSIREDQIVRALLRGGTNKQIALALKISEKTVKHYMTILMQKLNARNRVEVVIAAQKLGGYEHPVLHS
jgi:DNA-binding NarL/FixJ family response regulator